MSAIENRLTPPGWTYFSIYRNHSIYLASDPKSKYKYAAGQGETLTVFDYSFDQIRAQLDEITKPGRDLEVGPDIIIRLKRADVTMKLATVLISQAVIEIENLREEVKNLKEKSE